MKLTRIISAIVTSALSVNMIASATDGIKISDIRDLQSYLTAEKTISDEQYILFDMDKDNSVDVFDYIFMKHQLLENGVGVDYKVETDQFFNYYKNTVYTWHEDKKSASGVITSVGELTSYLSMFYEDIVFQKYTAKYNKSFFEKNVLFVNSFYQVCGKNPTLSVDSVNCTYDTLNIYVTDYDAQNIDNYVSALFTQITISKEDYYSQPVAWHITEQQPQTTTTATATTKSTETTVTTVTTTAPPVENKKLIDVKNIMQNPELPTGCEVTSLTILLNHLGFSADKVTMSRNYLPKLDFYWNNGIYYGADFRTTFAGNPESEYSYGCYAPCIETTANAYLSDIYSAKKAHALKGVSFENLLSEYIDNNMPVLIWITSSNLHEPYYTSIWTTPEGKEVQWLAYEHCVVMTGYDKDNQLIYVSDPLKGNISYDYSKFRQRYIDMGEQALYIK